MHITNSIAHDGVVAAGLAGLFTTAILGAKLAATAVIAIGELLIR